MILVLLGTHELPFTRLLKEVERMKIEGFIDEEIIVQNGNTKYTSDVLTLKPFVSYEEMDQLYDQASLVITHAGTGSVITGLKKDKKVIAVPRLKKYGEHNDDHQLELVKVFEDAGHILTWTGERQMEKVLEEVKDFQPVPFKSGEQKIHAIIEDFINKH